MTALGKKVTNKFRAKNGFKVYTKIYHSLSCCFRETERCVVALLAADALLASVSLALLAAARSRGGGRAQISSVATIINTAYLVLNTNIAQGKANMKVFGMTFCSTDTVVVCLHREINPKVRQHSSH